MKTGWLPRKIRLPRNGAIYGIALFIILFSILLHGDYVTLSNATNVFRQSATLSIITICSFLAIITHQTDLSVGATVSLSGIVAALMMDRGQPVYLAIIAAISAGLVVGAINGLLAGYTNIPTFIITLATMSIAGSIAMVLNAGTVRVSNSSFRLLSTGTLGIVPVPTVIAIAFYILFYFVLSHRPTGTHFYAVGGREEAALAAGINVKRIKMYVFLINGALAAFAGLIYAARLSAANPTQGIGLELDGICSAVLGGASLTGGKGKISGAFLGSIAISILRNGMNRLGLRVNIQIAVIGLVLILILAFDVFNKKREVKAYES